MLALATPSRVGPRLRISSYSVWETAVFAVNVLAFVVMGLQARPSSSACRRTSAGGRWRLA